MLSDRLRFRDIQRTSTFRLTVMLSLVSILGMIALLGLVYGMTARELTARSDRFLHHEATRLLSIPADQLPAQVTDDDARNLHGLDYLALTSSDGERIAGNLRAGRNLPRNRPIDIEGHGRRGPLRVLVVTTPGGETILLGRDISQIRDLRQHILLIVVVTGITMTIGMMLAAIALSLKPLRRVRDLQRVSREIAAGRLDRRMPIAGKHDELDQFAATVNVMVEDVGRVVSQVKGVTDAIAHDLRTPLTRVRAYLHRAQLMPDVPANIAGLADKAVTDLDVVLSRFAALLRISEIEASARRSGFATVCLSRLVENVIDLYEPLAEEGGIAMRLKECAPALVEADEKLLFEAISNLVDNAIKFARSAVSITVAEQAGAVSIDVRDDGPGIAPDEREAVLRRFHRGAHASGLQGSGLGLSVVAAIVHLHGYALSLEDADPGLLARVRIPKQ